MANFYENSDGKPHRWEEIGGFNIHLLTEIRNAMIDVRADSPPHPQLHLSFAEWVKRHPLYDFPDDEIG